MIIDYEREHEIDGDYIHDDMYVPQHPFVVIPRDPEQNGNQRALMIAGMQDSEMHTQLQHDLMVERWQKWFVLNAEDGMADEDGDDNDSVDMADDADDDEREG
jgi:hypothetical protein